MNKEQRKRLRPFISALKDAAESISNAKSEIEGIRDEEQEKLDNMPGGRDEFERVREQRTRRRLIRVRACRRVIGRRRVGVAAPILSKERL